MTLLELKDLTVHFGERLILERISLKLPQRGIVALMGPGGAGKSTLLRTLAGLNDANPHMTMSGESLYMGRPLGEGRRPALMVQRADLIAMTTLQLMATRLPGRERMTRVEQRDAIQRFLLHAGLGVVAHELDTDLLSLPAGLRRELLILRHVLADPALLCLDECAVGLDEPGPLLNRIHQEGQRRCVFMVTHNQAIAREIADQVLLLAGGRIQEHLPAPVFFTAPLSQAGRDWLQTGSCNVPAPDSDPGTLDPSYLIQNQLQKLPAREKRSEQRPDLRPEPISEALGPRGFRWVEPGRYGGTPQPGIVANIQFDLEALKRVGTSVLVTLTEEPLIHADLFTEAGIVVIHVPIDDMTAPDLDTAVALCEQCRQFAEEGEVVVYHCKAGIGRTGTMLAAQLIWEGLGSRDAMARVRAAEPKYIQSSEQETFLVQFARAVGSDRADVHPAATPNARLGHEPPLSTS